MNIIRTSRRKTCTKCGELKFLHNFYRSKNKKNHPDGYDNYCKECRKELGRDKYARLYKKPDGIFSYNGRTMKHQGCGLSIYWGEDKIRDFKRKYPFHTNAELAIDFGCSERTITRRARELGLEKDSQWIKEKHDYNLRKMIRQNKISPHYNREAFLKAGEPYRFVKGSDNGLTSEKRSEAAKKAWETKHKKMRLAKIKARICS